MDPRLRSYLGKKKDPYLDILNQQEQGQAQAAQRIQEINDRPQTDYNQYAALAKAMAQIGTIGGKAADTSAVDMAAQGYQGMQDQSRKNMMAQVANQEADIDRTTGLKLETLKYLQSQRDKQAAGAQAARDKAEDRAFKMQAMANKTQGAGGIDLSEGQKALDKSYASDQAGFLSGGKAKAQQNLQQVDSALADLSAPESKNFSGPGTAMAFGDTAASIFNPKALATFEKVKGQVLASAKEVLTGNMSDKDIETMVSGAFNRNLPIEANREKVAAIRDRMAAVLKAKEQTSDYFMKEGTLKGYKAPEEPAAPAPAPAPSGMVQVQDAKSSDIYEMPKEEADRLIKLGEVKPYGR